MLILENKVNDIQRLATFLEHFVKLRKLILFICEDVESEVLAMLIINKLKANLKVCAMKASGFGDNRKNMLYDISNSTGATVISEEIGLTLHNSIPQDVLGTSKKVIITKDTAVQSSTCKSNKIGSSAWPGKKHA